MDHHTFDATKGSTPDDASTRDRLVSEEGLQWALDRPGVGRVADLGSRLGFDTDTVGSRADYLYTVDVQEAMHQFASEAAHSELGRVLTPGGPLVIGDCAAGGTGKNGPPLDERYATADVTSTRQAGGLEIEFVATWPETLHVSGVADA
jgi:hypothetical protein